MGEKYLINIVEKENPANQNSLLLLFFTKAVVGNLIMHRRHL
jgi:hypothetical protein